MSIAFFENKQYKTCLTDGRFEISTAVKIQFEILRLATLCSVAVCCQSFGGPCCLHLQDSKPYAVSLPRKCIARGKKSQWEHFYSVIIFSVLLCFSDFIRRRKFLSQSEKNVVKHVSDTCHLRIHIPLWPSYSFIVDINQFLHLFQRIHIVLNSCDRILQCGVSHRLG
jgi:hypothetical protein